MSGAPLAIDDGVVVAIHYTLTNETGETLDSSEGQAPLEYLHGASNIVPGLEQALTGRKRGERLKVVVAPEDGYGERDPRGVQRVPRTAFPPNAEVEAGNAFHTEGPDGQPMVVWIVGIEGDRVVIDINHPLAGVTLHFDVAVEALRAATAEELEHGHPHGPGGHHHHDH